MKFARRLQAQEYGMTKAQRNAFALALIIAFAIMAAGAVALI